MGCSASSTVVNDKVSGSSPSDVKDSLTVINETPKDNTPLEVQETIVEAVAEVFVSNLKAEVDIIENTISCVDSSNQISAKANEFSLTVDDISCNLKETIDSSKKDCDVVHKSADHVEIDNQSLDVVAIDLPVDDSDSVPVLTSDLLEAVNHSVTADVVAIDLPVDNSVPVLTSDLLEAVDHSVTAEAPSEQQRAVIENQPVHVLQSQTIVDNCGNDSAGENLVNVEESLSKVEESLSKIEESLVENSVKPSIDLTLSPSSETVVSEENCVKAEESLPKVEESPTEPPSLNVVNAVAEPNLKKGFILKQGHIIKNWKNRFFVLELGKLQYFENSMAEHPFGVNKKGELNLDGMIVTTNGNKLCITYAADTEKNLKVNSDLILDIRFDEEREEWAKAVREHIAYAGQLKCQAPARLDA